MTPDSWPRLGLRATPAEQGEGCCGVILEQECRGGRGPRKGERRGGGAFPRGAKATTEVGGPPWWLRCLSEQSTTPG